MCNLINDDATSNQASMELHVNFSGLAFTKSTDNKYIFDFFETLMETVDLDLLHNYFVLDNSNNYSNVDKLVKEELKSTGQYFNHKNGVTAVILANGKHHYVDITDMSSLKSIAKYFREVNASLLDVLFNNSSDYFEVNSHYEAKHCN